LDNPYDKLPADKKLAYMGCAAQCLSLKPELTGEAKTGIDLIAITDSFAKALCGHLHPQKDESGESRASVGESDTLGV